MSPFSPEAAVIRAGRLLLTEINIFSQKRVSFGFETTLSGRSYLNLVQRLKKRGYRIYLFFLFVEAVDVTLSRIRERVLKGGHDVPEDVVRRRFDRSVRNFFREYQQLVDAWYLFDNTGTKPMPIAFKKGRRVRIINSQTYEMLISRYGER
jgi:predicted ABC-type ATPase